MTSPTGSGQFGDRLNDEFLTPSFYNPEIS